MNCPGNLCGHVFFSESDVMNEFDQALHTLQPHAHIVAMLKKGYRPTNRSIDLLRQRIDIYHSGYEVDLLIRFMDAYKIQPTVKDFYQLIGEVCRHEDVLRGLEEMLQRVPELAHTAQHGRGPVEEFVEKTSCFQDVKAGDGYPRHIVRVILMLKKYGAHVDKEYLKRHIREIGHLEDRVIIMRSVFPSIRVGARARYELKRRTSKPGSMRSLTSK